MKINCLIAFLLFGFSGFSQNKLPNVILKDLDGKEVNLASYNNSDKPVIVTFWATWCGPCINELTAIKDVYADWQKETGVELIAVSIDDARTKARVKPMVKGKSWKYKVLMDDNHELKRAMNVVNPPYTFVYYKGNKIYSHSSYTPGIENELFKQVQKAIGR